MVVDMFRAKEMSMQTGTKVVCIDEKTPIAGIIKGKEYKFISYDESSIPKNRKNAIMSWYPDVPMWTPEEYEHIRHHFMLIKLEGVDRPQWLKDFKIL